MPDVAQIEMRSTIFRVTSITVELNTGVSGNPGGRPSGKGLSAYLSDALEAPGADGRPGGELVAEKLVNLALSGNLKANGIIFDRTEGWPCHSIALGSLAHLSDEELIRQVQALFVQVAFERDSDNGVVRHR